jgi:hypothetical protein
MLRLFIIACAGLIACAVSSPTAQTSVATAPGPDLAAPGKAANASKKLIEYGWDKPKPTQLTTAKLEASIFDGVIFRSSAGDRTFTKTPVSSDGFDADIAAFKAIKSKKLENSFYDIQSYAPQDWDWFDETSWKSSLANLTQSARVAKQSGLRGVMFDPEPYEFNPWDYAAQARAKTLSFAQYEAKLRERGAQAMRALEVASPGLSFFALKWLSIFDLDYAAAKSAANPYAALHAQLESDGSGLWVSFVEGMLSAASGQVRFIDGNEGSYDFLRASDFDTARTQALGASGKSLQLVQSDLRQKYAQQVSFGNSIFLDGVLNLFDSARFFGYYLKSDQERLNLVTHNIYHGLRSSDEFVWVYGETPDWWKPSLPNGLEAAVARGRSELLAGKPLSNDPTNAVKTAESAYNKRVDVGGELNGTGGRTPDFGPLKNHCATWSNATRWSCTQAGGSSFTVTPKIDGVTFDPPSMTFEKLTKSTWGQTFNAK